MNRSTAHKFIFCVLLVVFFLYFSTVKKTSAAYPGDCAAGDVIVGSCNDYVPTNQNNTGQLPQPQNGNYTCGLQAVKRSQDTGINFKADCEDWCAYYGTSFPYNIAYSYYPYTRVVYPTPIAPIEAQQYCPRSQLYPEGQPAPHSSCPRIFSSQFSFAPDDGWCSGADELPDDNVYCCEYYPTTCGGGTGATLIDGNNYGTFPEYYSSPGDYLSGYGNNLTCTTSLAYTCPAGDTMKVYLSYHTEASHGVVKILKNDGTTVLDSFSGDSGGYVLKGPYGPYATNSLKFSFTSDDRSSTHNALVDGDGFYIYDITCIPPPPPQCNGDYSPQCNNAPCCPNSDGNECTWKYCSNHVCIAPVNKASGIPCTNGTCDGAGNCHVGCSYESDPVCVDGNPCTTDTCTISGNTGTCSHSTIANTTVCGKDPQTFADIAWCCSNVCRGDLGSTCTAPQCTVAADCTGDTSPCKTPTCTSGVCSYPNKGNGVACTPPTGGTCSSGVCQVACKITGPSTDISYTNNVNGSFVDNNANFYNSTCNLATDTCSYMPVPGPGILSNTTNTITGTMAAYFSGGCTNPHQYKYLFSYADATTNPSTWQPLAAPAPTAPPANGWKAVNSNQTLESFTYTTPNIFTQFSKGVKPYGLFLGLGTWTWTNQSTWLNNWGFIQFFYSIASTSIPVQANSGGILTGEITMPAYNDVLGFGGGGDYRPAYFLYIQSCTSTTTCNAIRANQSSYGSDSVGTGEIRIPADNTYFSDWQPSPTWTATIHLNNILISTLTTLTPGTTYAFRLRQHGTKSDLYIPSGSGGGSPTFTIPAVIIRGKNVDVNGATLTTDIGQLITLSNGQIKNDSAFPGVWNFGNNPPDLYRVTANIPPGYDVSYSKDGFPYTSGPSDNVVGAALYSNGDYVDINFKYTLAPLYTISGYIFKDSNGDFKRINADTTVDPNNTDPVTVTVTNNSTGSSRSYPVTGSYTTDVAGVKQLPRGNYTVTFSGTIYHGYNWVYPTPILGVRSLGVTIGTGCSYPGESLEAGCSGGDVTNLNAVVALPKSAWFQSIGSDMRWDSGFSDSLPSATTFASKPDPFTHVTGGMPGIIFSGGTDPSFGPDGLYASAPNWKVGSFSYPDFYTTSHNSVPTSYNYLLGTVNKSSNVVKKTLLSDLCKAGTGQTNCDLNTAHANAAYLIDLSGGTLTISGSDYTFPAGNFVILINGSLIISNKILVPNTSTVIFSASGNITVDGSVGEPAATACDITSPTHAGCDIEGLYSADVSFIAAGANDCKTGVDTAGADKRLNIAGTVVANAGRGSGTFTNNRTLCGSNITTPSVTFTERPDFMLNYPTLVQQTSKNLQNIAP